MFDYRQKLTLYQCYSTTWASPVVHAVSVNPFTKTSNNREEGREMATRWRCCRRGESQTRERYRESGQFNLNHGLFSTLTKCFCAWRTQIVTTILPHDKTLLFLTTRTIKRTRSTTLARVYQIVGSLLNKTQKPANHQCATVQWARQRFYNATIICVKLKVLSKDRIYALGCYAVGHWQ